MLPKVSPCTKIPFCYESLETGIKCVHMRTIEAASRMRNIAASVARREGGVGGGSRETFSTLCSSSSSSSSLSSYVHLSFHCAHSWRTVQWVVLPQSTSRYAVRIVFFPSIISFFAIAYDISSCRPVARDPRSRWNQRL